MKTLLKWPGGKERELSKIRPYIPSYTGRYVEPFVGGGAVFWDIPIRPSCINDISIELINLYHCIKNKDIDFQRSLQTAQQEFSALGELADDDTKGLLEVYTGAISIEDFIVKHRSCFASMAKGYNSVFMKELVNNFQSKILRSKRLEASLGNISNEDKLSNMETAMKSVYYMYMRYLMNSNELVSFGKQAAIFYFIREYCFSSMFRYSQTGKFNVPYGGKSYNRKNFQKKIDYLLSEEVAQKLDVTDIYCEDFEDFLNGIHLTEDDFLFCDPPYDTHFSTYARNSFGHSSQMRLCEYLKHTPAKVLLVIKYTDFIYDLYKDDFHITSFDKQYLVSIMNRNERAVKHLVITNY